MKKILLAMMAIAVIPLSTHAGDLSFTSLPGASSGSNPRILAGDGQTAVNPDPSPFSGAGVSKPDAHESDFDGWSQDRSFHAPVNAHSDLVAEPKDAHPNFISSDNRAYLGDVGARHLVIPHSESWLMARHSNSQQEPGEIDRDSRVRPPGNGGVEYKFSNSRGLVTDASHRKIFVGPRISF